MRYYDWTPAVATPVGGGTIAFPYQLLKGSNVVAFNIVMTGAANALNAGGPPPTGLSQIRVLIGTDVFWDVSAAALVAWTEAFTPANINLANTSLTFSLPFYDPLAPTMDEADMSQLPAGQPEIQLVFGSASVAGFVNVQIVRSSIAPRWTHTLRTAAMNIPASQSNFPYVIPAQAGVCRGVVFPTTGLSRLELKLGDVPVMRATGPTFTPALDQFPITNQWRNPQASFATALQRAFYLGDELPVPAEGSSFLADTAVGWAGVANPLSLYMRRDLVQT